MISLAEVDKLNKTGDPVAIKVTTKKQVSFLFSNFSKAADLEAAYTTLENLVKAGNSAPDGDDSAATGTTPVLEATTAT